MPVVLNKSTLFKPDSDPLGPEVKPELARGRPIVATGSIVNASNDSQNSKYLLAELPSGCILGSHTYFKVDTWGYADIRIGTFTDPAALSSVLRSAGAIHSPVAQGDARHGQPLWQALGLAADPGGVIQLYLHGNVAAPTGAGSSKFEIHYRYR